MKAKTPARSIVRILFVISILSIGICSLTFRRSPVRANAQEIFAATSTTTAGQAENRQVNLQASEPAPTEQPVQTPAWLKTVLEENPSPAVFESDPAGLPDGARARLGLGALKACALSQDGEYLATGSSTGVYLFRADNIAEVWRYITEQPVSGVAFSPDGALIAAITQTDVVLIETSTGQAQRELAHQYAVNLIAFSPDGNTLATVTGPEVRFWNPGTGELTSTYVHDEAVVDLAWSPDGEWVTLGGARIYLTNLVSGEISILETGEYRSVTSLAWSANGAVIAAGLSDGSTLIWDQNSKQPRFTPAAHNLWVSSVALSLDGRLLATGGRYGEVLVWDTYTGENLQVFSGHQAEVVGLHFTPDSQQLVSGGLDNVINEWDVNSGARLRVFDGHTDAVSALAWSPDGAWIATGGVRGGINIWNAQTGERSGKWTEHSEAVTRLVWSPDSETLVSLSADKTALIWSVRSGQILQHLEQPKDEAASSAKIPDGLDFGGAIEGALLDAAFSPDGSLLVTGGEDTFVTVWDAASGEALQRLNGHTVPVQYVVYLSGQLITVSLDGTIIHWDPVTFEILDRKLYPGKASLVISQTGERVALGLWEGGLILWDAASDAPITALQDSNDAGVRAQFSPDGDLLVSGSSAQLNQVILWDAASGKAIRPIAGHNSEVSGLAFSPDGGVLATVSWDGSLLLWDLR